MSNPTTVPTRPCCPSWCTVTAHDDQANDQLHQRTWTCSHSSTVVGALTVSLETTSHVTDGIAAPVIAVESEPEPLDWDTQISIEQGEWLGRTLLEAVKLVREEPHLPAVECLDCGHAFHPDSSPDLDRCWSCAERFAAETGDDQ